MRDMCGSCGGWASGEPVVIDHLASVAPERYTIVRELGRGGMATVFLAQDLKHERRVAVKVLRPELGATLGPERFLREIKLTAKLSHPHILPLLDSGDAEGLLYYVMPFAEGESLRDRLKREKQLPIDEAVQIACEVADALSYAHGHDVIHRDVKPENILLEGGHAVVADFGIARAINAASGANLTATGLAIGTPVYMSPEQASGEQDLDGRSDLYSLGCVLYEMLAGQPPFTGLTTDGVIRQHLTAAPPDVRVIRPAVPASLAAALNRALAKTPADRFNSVTLFADALTRAESMPLGGAPSAKPSIVVLPFDDISPGRDNEFFADGLTEEIIAALSKINALRVISRTSAMWFKGARKDIRAIARELDVRYVLEGSVRKAGNNLRITAQLIDTVTDEHLWSESYSGTLDDVFAIQEQVARAIVGELRVKLTPEESKAIAARPIASPAAYECYLRAKSEIWRFTEEGLERGLREVEHALALVGPNALLYAIQGLAYWQYVNLGLRPARVDEYLDKAEAAARKIQALDARLSHGDRLLSLVSLHRGRFAEGYRHAQQAIEKDPRDVESLVVFASWTIWGVGLSDPARRASQEIVSVDPLWALGHTMLGAAALTDGRFDEAECAFERAYELDPGNPFAGFGYVQTLAIQGKTEQAIELADRLAGTSPEEFWLWLIAFFRSGLAGDRDRARQLWSSEWETTARIDPQYALYLAESYALLNEVDQALEWLGVAIQRGLLCFRFLSEVDPFLANVRTDPRFAVLMQRCSRERERVLSAW
jgi:serine/threonine protein kinase/tetratricopeptide (TPR) repeat protein